MLIFKMDSNGHSIESIDCLGYYGCIENIKCSNPRKKKVLNEESITEFQKFYESPTIIII
jgi:hypothetical protein